MHPRVFKCLLLCLFSMPFVGVAQRTTAQMLGVEQGLSQGMVFDLLHSRDGYLWTSTKDGLNRYDGYRFEVFVPDPFDPFSVAASEISRMFEDSRGWLWLCYAGGVDVYPPGGRRFFHLPMAGFSGFAGHATTLAEQSDGAIWLLCNGFLWRIELPESALREADGADNAYPAYSCQKVEAPENGNGPGFHSLCSRKNGELLATAKKSLFRISGSSGATPRPEFLQTLDEEFFLLGEDTCRGVFMYSHDGLWRLDNPLSPPQKVFDVAEVQAWYAGDDGSLWGVGKGKTLYRWRTHAPECQVRLELTLHFQVPYTPNEVYYFTALTSDNNENVWLGASGYGMYKLQTAQPKFRSYLPLISLRQLVEDPSGNLFSMRQWQSIYFGKSFDEHGPNPWMAAIPAEEQAVCVRFDRQGNGWVRTQLGNLYRVDAQTKTATRVDLGGIGLLIDSHGRLLTITNEALLVYDPAMGRTSRHAFGKPLHFQHDASNEHILLFEDGAANLWITAFDGLLQAVPVAEGYQFRHFLNDPKDRRSLSNNFVLCVAEDPANPRRYLWVGTKGGGLNRLDRSSGQMTHYLPEDGLPDRVVYGILPDNRERLWISTNKGLCRMSFSGETPVFKNFTTADGLQSSEFNRSSFLKTTDGTLLFGGVNGVTVFHPDSLRFRNNPPPTRIVGIQVGADRYPRPEDLPRRLSHRQNLLLFEFAALDFTNPSQNQYRYQLIRSDLFGRRPEAPWVDLGARNSVQLANLSPGRYTFRVLGSNDEGTWSLQPAEVQFTIRPPWWATGWAYAAYVVLLGAALLFYARFRWRKRAIEQEALRLRELDAFKMRFFTNITHEFRTPLTVILGMTERLESDEAVSGLPLAKKSLPLIRRNGENLLKLINQLLDLAKLESNALTLHYVQDDVLPYLRYIVESLHSLAIAQQVTLHTETDQAQIRMAYDPERLLQIVYNLLSNAIKFTPAGGKVVLTAALEAPAGAPPNLKLTVADTGVGIPPEDLPYIFERFYQAKNLEKAGAGGTGIGLALTRELVKALQGEISVSSTPGEGTVFTVRLPVWQKEGEPGRDLPVADYAAAPALDRETANAPAALDQPAVLLIEDNPDVMEYLMALLGGRFQLDIARNGLSGTEKAIANIPDLIVSDVMMPEKDGFEVVETLKNDERTSHIPIVLLTAKADVDSRIAGLRRGADAYLAKPFHKEELLATLDNLLEVRKKLQVRYGHGAAAPAAPPDETDPEDVFLQKIRHIVEQNLSEPGPDMPQLEQALAMSRSQVFRKVKALTGRSPTQFVRSVRLRHGRHLLQTTDRSVSEIAYEVGFSSVKYFSDAFLEEFGERPTGVRG